MEIKYKVFSAFERITLDTSLERRKGSQSRSGHGNWEPSRPPDGTDHEEET